MLCIDEESPISIALDAACLAIYGFYIMLSLIVKFCLIFQKAAKCT